MVTHCWANNGTQAPLRCIIFKSGMLLVKFGTVNLEQKVWMLMGLMGKAPKAWAWVKGGERLWFSFGSSDQLCPTLQHRFSQVLRQMSGRGGRLTHKCADSEWVSWTQTTFSNTGVRNEIQQTRCHLRFYSALPKKGQFLLNTQISTQLTSGRAEI